LIVKYEVPYVAIHSKDTKYNLIEEL